MPAMPLTASHGARSSARTTVTTSGPRHRGQPTGPAPKPLPAAAKLTVGVLVLPLCLPS